MNLDQAKVCFQILLDDMCRNQVRNGSTVPDVTLEVKSVGFEHHATIGIQVCNAKNNPTPCPACGNVGIKAAVKIHRDIDLHAFVPTVSSQLLPYLAEASTAHAKKPKTL